METCSCSSAFGGMGNNGSKEKKGSISATMASKLFIVFLVALLHLTFLALSSESISLRRQSESSHLWESLTILYLHPKDQTLNCSFGVCPIFQYCGHTSFMPKVCVYFSFICTKGESGNHVIFIISSAINHCFKWLTSPPWFKVIVDSFKIFNGLDLFDIVAC